MTRATTRPLDGFFGFVGAADLVPDFQTIGLLLRQNDSTLRIFGFFQQNIDGVADDNREGSVILHELPGGHESFGLEPDVDLDVVVVDRQHDPADDFSLFEGLADDFEQFGE